MKGKRNRSRELVFRASVLLAVLSPVSLAGGSRFGGLVAGLDAVRQRLAIPGCSLAVGYGDGSIETAGLGYADLEQGLPATADTQYHIASLSKGFAALVALQLEAEGRLDLAFSMADTARFSDSAVTLRRILSHTAMRPDEGFRYRSDHFMQLTPVLESAARQPWPAMLEERIFVPLGMTMTVPGREYFPTQHRLVKLARPYRVTGSEVRSIAMPSPECNAAYGIVSTVRDLVAWSRALDSGRLVSPEQAVRLFTRNRNQRGDEVPYGLGWFVSDVAGEMIQWHYGWRVPGYGALIVRIPRRGLTFVILANSDRLVSDATLAYGNPLRSIFVIEFLRRYLLPGRPDEVFSPVDPDWQDGELVGRLSRWTNSQRHLYPEELMARGLVESRIGNWKNALRLMRHALELFPDSRGLCDLGTLQTLHWQRQEPFIRAALSLGERLLRNDPADPWVLQEIALLSRRGNPGDGLRHDLRILGIPWAGAGMREAALGRIAGSGADDPRLLWRALELFGLSGRIPAGVRKVAGSELDAIRRHAYWLEPLSRMTNWQ